jgi:hypothetical protein
LKSVAVRLPVEELNVRFVPVLIGRFPVAAVTNATKQVVSALSSAQVTALATPEVKLAAVPEMFVPTSVDGVPRLGVVSTGDVARTGAPDPVAVVHTGRADAPPPTSTSVVAPAASVCCAPVAVVPVATSA